MKGNNAKRGYAWLYQNHVMQADEGCDFDFMKAKKTFQIAEKAILLNSRNLDPCWHQGP